MLPDIKFSTLFPRHDIGRVRHQKRTSLGGPSSCPRLTTVCSDFDSELPTNQKHQQHITSFFCSPISSFYPPVHSSMQARHTEQTRPPGRYPLRLQRTKRNWSLALRRRRCRERRASNGTRERARGRGAVGARRRVSASRNGHRR